MGFGREVGEVKEQEQYERSRDLLIASYYDSMAHL